MTPVGPRRRSDATIIQDGRAKAYRPVPRAARRAALRGAFAAWARGDFFETHELLEPAWMGARDGVERSLYQGLIKLAAAFVHAVRGNPIGTERSLAAARRTIDRVSGTEPTAEGLDLPVLLAAIDALLVRFDPEAGVPLDLSTLEPPALRLAVSAGRVGPAARGHGPDPGLDGA